MLFLVSLLVFCNLHGRLIKIPESCWRRISHIPVSRNPAERPSHYPIITGDTFRAACDHIVDETKTIFDLAAVKPADTIFVGTPYVDFFLKDILPNPTC